MDASATPAAHRPMRTVRLERGYGLRATARAIGIDPSALLRIETGRARVDAELLVRLAKHLDAPMESLV